MRARQRLRHAPGGAAIGRRQRFDHPVEGQDVGGAAAERCGHQHPRDAGVVDRGDDVVGDPPLALGAVGAGRDDGREAARPRHPVDCAVLALQRAAPAG